MKKVLIPTDFSDNANSALEYALKLYANRQCTFYFLHSTYMLNPDNRSHITPHYIDQINKSGIENLEKLKTEKEHTNANHNFEIIISKKKLRVALNKAVKKHDIELIIMGTKGSTAAIEYFAGSNTISVIKKIKKCPVLAIPDAYVFNEPKQMAFPTGYSRLYSNEELSTLIKTAKFYNSEIRILHIGSKDKLTDVQKDNKEVLQTHLNDLKHSFHFVQDNSRKSENIETFIDDFKIDMVVMVNYKHSFIENMINEPVIKNLMFHPKTPLLIIPK